MTVIFWRQCILQVTVILQFFIFGFQVNTTFRPKSKHIYKYKFLLVFFNFIILMWFFFDFWFYLPSFCIWLFIFQRCYHDSYIIVFIFPGIFCVRIIFWFFPGLFPIIFSDLSSWIRHSRVFLSCNIFPGAIVAIRGRRCFQAHFVFGEYRIREKIGNTDLSPAAKSFLQ